MARPSELTQDLVSDAADQLNKIDQSMSVSKSAISTSNAYATFVNISSVGFAAPRSKE